MTDQFRLMLVWIVGSAAALVVALAPISGAFADGHYVPIGPDAFYHARRILDAVADPSAFYQFDTHMHIPEGSLIVWPWGYDYAMSLLVRLGLALHLSRDAMAVLAHIPVFAFTICIGLVLTICRQLGMGIAATALAALATAFFPLNQSLYGVGAIDHHFAEHLWVLGSLACGLAWLREPASRGRAIAAAVVLGLAPAIHNALFIVQLPLVLAFGWLWLRGLPRPANTVAFAVTLVIVTTLVAIPSLSFREGNFQFYTLSWFHIYAAACTGGICVALGRSNYSLRNLAILIGLALALLAPIAGQVLLGADFISLNVEGLDAIGETQSLWTFGTAQGGHGQFIGLYTYIAYLVPVAAALCAWGLWRDRDPMRAYFWIASLFGLALLVTQIRLQYFGSFALYIPFLLTIDAWARNAPVKPLLVWAVVAVLLAAIYSPGVRYRIFARQVVSTDPYYDTTRKLYPKFAEQCARAPGAVLAPADDGHYIRFHTSCSVIANNFLLTPQQVEKLREVKKLFASSAADVPRLAPYLRYVYVRRESMFLITPEGTLSIAPFGITSDPDPKLTQELLAAPVDQLPPRYRLVDQLIFGEPIRVPYARLFEIMPAASAAQ